MSPHRHTPHPALLRAAVSALPPLPPAPQSATPRHEAPHPDAPDKTNPRPPHSTPPAVLPNGQWATGNRQSLSPRQLHAARLLLAGRSVNATAAALGLSRYTISRWKQNPTFQAEVHRLLNPSRTPQGAPQSATFRHKAPHEPPAGKNEPTAP